jgi:uncharacterized protein Yka (UPF0111/DUF47 family)
MTWFLPHTPDVLALLRRQLAVTIEGLDAFREWAAGDAAAERRVRDCEHQADVAKRDVHRALREAFVTPLEPEDLFALSTGIDRLINQAKDTVRESEVMACAPDQPLGEIAALLATAARELDTAVAALSTHGPGATAGAERAIKDARRIERVYRSAMAELLTVDDLREVIARRELYRRGARIGDSVVDVAERVLYAIVKEA